MGHQPHPTTVPTNADADKQPVNTVYIVRGYPNSSNPYTVGLFSNREVAEDIAEYWENKIRYDEPKTRYKVRERKIYSDVESYHDIRR